MDTSFQQPDQHGQPATAKHASRTRRSTVILLQSAHSTFGAGLDHYVNSAYEESHGFVSTEVTVAGIPCLQYTGVLGGGKQPEWGQALRSVSGVRPEIENKSSAGVLIIPVDGNVFALCYGMGHLLLNADQIAPDFGFSFALRALQADAIRHVTHTMLDARGRTDRNSAAEDQPIHGFGLEEFGEIVTRLGGKLESTALTFSQGRSKSVQVCGAESLRIPLGLSPEDLIADLTEISRVLAKESPAPEFDAIAKVRPLRSHDNRLRDLDKDLDALLGGAEHGRLALVVPTQCLNSEDSTQSYRVKIGPRRVFCEELTLDFILGQVAQFSPGERLLALKNGYIQVCQDADGHNPAGRRIAANRWLAAEITRGNSRLFHHEGRWYEVGEQHLEGIQAQIAEILGAPAGLLLPDWLPTVKDEGAYNEEVAGQEEGFVCMDRALIKPRLHPRGIESCDLLGPGNELIHVKRAASTAPLNHLFAQGRISAEALRWDSTARKDMAVKVLARSRKQGSARVLPLDFTPKKVIYAISLKSGKPVTAASLFTFAQVSLLQAVTALRRAGIEVAVVNISTIL